MYIQINIGRNFSNENGAAGVHADPIWRDFQFAMMDAIMDAIQASLPTGQWPSAFHSDDEYAAFEIHTGMGEWDGIREESAHISVYFDHDGRRYDGILGKWFPTAPDIREHLSASLSTLAKQYGQDAIAFVVTDSYLAGA